MTTRVIGTCLIGADWCGLNGDLADAPFSGGSCPATIPHIRFGWTKAESALTSGEQADIDAVRTLLQSYLDSEESCADLRGARYFVLTLGSVGAVQVATAWIDGPTVGGVVRQLWARWSKQRAAFSSGERADLDALVSILAAYLVVEEPI